MTSIQLYNIIISSIQCGHSRRLHVNMICCLFMLLVGTAVAQWNTVAPAPTENDLLSVNFLSSTTGYACGMNGALVKTSDGGITWISVPTGHMKMLAAVRFADASTGYIAGESGCMYKTTDGGASFVEMPPTGGGDCAAIAFPTANTGYASDWNGILQKTTDGGATWSNVQIITTLSLVGMHFMDEMHGCIVGGDFSTGSSGILIRTTDGGATWTSPLSSLSAPVNAVHFCDADFGACAGSNGVLYTTSDGGATWKKRTTVSGSLVGVSVVSPSVIYATDGGIIFKSLDTGMTWHQQMNDPLGSINSLAMADMDHGAAVGAFGFILYTFNGGGVVSVSDMLRPESPILMQNFPNPCSPNTSIRFFVPVRSMVRLVLYNAAGNRVAVLEEGVRDRGTYTVVLNSNGLFPGVYFYELSCGHWTQRRKCVVLR